MPTAPRRSYWTWHRWLGLGVLLPLLWWTGTALVFALRPMEEIHGLTYASGRRAETTPLAPGLLPAPGALDGVTAVTVRRVEGHQVALLERGQGAPEVVDLEAGRPLGGAIPLEWALAAARRDFGGAFDLEVAYLHPRSGPARRVAGDGPETVARAEEYAGPLPAYAIHLRGWPRMHLWVDALGGEVRSRRTATWRLYDLAFRLHALDFLPDGAKRAVMWLVVVAWLALGATGLRLAVVWLGRRARPRRPAPRP